MKHAKRRTIAQWKSDPGLRLLLGRVHVGTLDDDVARDFRSRFAPHYDETDVKRIVSAALHIHEQNRRLYCQVMRGF